MAARKKAGSFAAQKPPAMSRENLSRSNPRSDIPSRALAVALQKLGILAPATRLVEIVVSRFSRRKE
jgi:hypothetical protein